MTVRPCVSVVEPPDFRRLHAMDS